MKLFARSSHNLAALLALSVVLLSGCMTLNNLTATQTVIANQVLTLGAELYIQKAGGTVTPPALYSKEQQARAQSLKDFAVQVNGFATGSITLASLDVALTGWVAKAKTPLDLTLRQALIAEVNVLLATRVQTGVLNGAATALVSEITLDWINAAKAYGAV